MSDFATASHVRTMMVRTRFIDDALEQAVKAGATQLLVLGAGFDSHAYRFEDQLEGVRVFEADRPAMLKFKRRRVLEVLGAVPANVTYVATDFQDADLRQVLTAAGYDFDQPSFIIMEGLTMYLREQALRETLALVASHRAGSRVVFDFVSSAMVAGLKSVDISQVPEIGRPFVQRFLNLIRDEPWEFGFPINRENAYIEEFGLEIHDLLVLDSEEAVRRYLTKPDGTEVAQATMARMPTLPTGATREQRLAMAYRICEAGVARRH